MFKYLKLTATVWDSIKELLATILPVHFLPIRRKWTILKKVWLEHFKILRFLRQSTEWQLRDGCKPKNRTSRECKPIQCWTVTHKIQTKVVSFWACNSGEESVMPSSLQCPNHPFPTSRQEMDRKVVEY